MKNSIAAISLCLSVLLVGCSDSDSPKQQASAIAYQKGYLVENGLICDRPEKVGEFLYRLEKYNSFNTPGCLINTSNQQIPVFIIDSGHVNGEDVTEAKVSMDKASFWTLTSNLH